MRLLTEEVLLQLASEGHANAFAELHDRYRPLLYRFVYSIVKSSDVTKDICQEVFLRIWEDRGRLPEISAFKSYLLTAGKNLSLNVLKKVLSEEKNLSSFVKTYEQTSSSVDDEWQTIEYQRFIQSVLATLPNQSRRVFELCRQQGLSYEEVAAELGVSRNIIKKHMVRSMKVLKIAVEKDLGITFSVLATVLFEG
ncbi:MULTISPECIES: RNA polymerase sigma factor [Siphonobacter]|uniref:RNA polymerase subunit sigma-70 n=1 Tax=Siphonobacter curvatus TaxID=2094562 RepID=A0A2S7II80_9BACT|nr:RNA polymerase sigma-70 factor [Siphonobacter curvatus]PQA55643.1 RNA polymerase subunit sigma-70 [Siphonobacter curvatus]